MFTNPFIELAGTLVSPRVGMGAKGATSTAAAVATGGVSVLAQGFMDRARGSQDLCKETLTWPPGRRSEPPRPGDACGGDPLRGAGRGAGEGGGAGQGATAEPAERALDGRLRRDARATHIRVLVPYSRTLYYIDKGHERGITAELMREFER